MLLKPVILKHLTTTLIGLYGITDIIHANNTNIMPELSQTYGSIIGSSVIISQMHLTTLLDALFLIASIIHFRRDMPEIGKIPKYVWSSTLLFTTQTYPELFVLYMLAIHVPHHYKMNWEYMKQTPRFSVLLLIITSCIMGFMGNSIDTNDNMDLIMTITKGIIISHIVYEEKYIFNESMIKN